MKTQDLYPRLLEPRLEEALAESPVTLIHGPRQCGKTTLARIVGDRRGHSYFTLDDPITAEAIRADPVGFVADLPPRATLDEVQRAPELFPAIKAAVDRDRTSGRFLITGSANVLLVPKLSESLAGRMEIIRLHPLSEAELARTGAGFLEALFLRGPRTATGERLGTTLAERIARGGYPEAVKRASNRRRNAWYRDYVEAIVQRDVRDLARIRKLEALPRLLALAASQTARLVNIEDLSGPFQLSRPTVRDYVTLLTRVFLLEELQPWHSNRISRLIKTPKLHMCDTGLACALLGLDADSLWSERELLGRLLETFVYQELRRQASAWDQTVSFYHFRDKDKAEVDIVLERGPSEIVGLEVKAAASVKRSDLRGLRRLRSAAGERFRRGIILYDGEVTAPFGDDLFAVPICRLWEEETG